MIKKLAALGCLLALTSCIGYNSVKKEDLVVAPGERIPLKVGILNIQTTHLGASGIHIAEEDRGVVLDQARKLMEPIFDRVSENPRLSDTDVLVYFEYTTKIKKNTASCTGAAVFLKAGSSREVITEIRTKAVNEGRLSDREGLVRYNAVLKAQRQLVAKMKGHERLREFAKKLGRKVEPKPASPIGSTAR